MSICMGRFLSVVALRARAPSFGRFFATSPLRRPACRWGEHSLRRSTDEIEHHERLAGNDNLAGA
jgi:hypothetical protein